MIKNMTTYVHDEMIKNYETLIFYILKDIKIVELRRIIWEKYSMRTNQKIY